MRTRPNAVEVATTASGACASVLEAMAAPQASWSYWAMPKFASVDDYLASLPVEQRAVVEEIERRVLAVVPGAERVIRYDMPTWQVDGTSLVHVAAWKKHVSLYPVPPEGDPQLDADLASYAGAKGTLKLPYSGIDYTLIERAVRRLLETR